MNRSTVFILQQGLCTISGKNSDTLTLYLAMLGPSSSVTEFDKVCTQFEDKWHILSDCSVVRAMAVETRGAGFD